MCQPKLRGPLIEVHPPHGAQFMPSRRVSFCETCKHLTSLSWSSAVTRLLVPVLAVADELRTALRGR